MDSDKRKANALFDGEAFEVGSVAEALVGGEEREVLGLLAAEDEGGGELEGVGGTERMDAEETDGAGADFGSRGDFGPLLGHFMQAFPCRMFDVRWQLTIALAADQRGLDFREGTKPHHGPRIHVVLLSSQVGRCLGDE
jgi:hypothetical protein